MQSFITKMNSFQVPQTINPLGWTIVCLSDTHSKLGKIPRIPFGDIIIHAGDFSNVGELPDIQKFHQEFSKLPHPIKIFIAGNHDLSIEKDRFCNPDYAPQFNRYAERAELSIRQYHEAVMKVVRNSECEQGYLQYLQDDACLISCHEQPDLPIKVYGSPWQPEFFDWAFNLPRGLALKEKWSMIHPDTDILITHGPPHGILDMTNRNESVGCEELRKLFDSGKITPRLHIFGHIHEAYGCSLVNNTMYCNASTCTLSYRPSNAPIVVFLPHDKSKPAEILSYSQNL